MEDGIACAFGTAESSRSRGHHFAGIFWLNYFTLKSRLAIARVITFS